MNDQTRFRTLHLGLLFASLSLITAACASSGVGQDAPTATAPAAIIAAENTPTSPPPTATAPQPTTTATATATPTPTQPTPTPLPLITATPPPTPDIIGLDNTLVLYTALTAIRPTDDPLTYWDPYYGFKTWPPLPFVDPTVFDTHYGKRAQMSEISMFFFDHRAQASPDGRYVLVPGLPSYPGYGVEGTGTWLLDLAAEEARQLLPDGVIATWSPASDAITYVAGTTLYTLSTTAGATPQPLFEEPNLWPLYAKWSPDGRWIAAMSGVQDEATGDVTFTYWLVPPDGGPARQFARRVSLVGEFNATEMSWSADGQFLLAHNFVYDLEGNQLLPTETGGLTWLPDRTQLLQRGNGLRFLNVAGEDVDFVEQSADQWPIEWAFSRDGRRLAFSLSPTDGGIPLAIHEVENGQTEIVGVIPDAFYVFELHWSGEDATLLVTADHGEARYDIWTLPTAPNSTAERLIADAILIEAVPSP